MGGFDVANRNVFFTHNGNYLGVAFEKVRSNLFPCIAFTSPGEHVIVNFGKYPFLWDFTTKAEPFKPAPLAMVSMYDIPPVRAGLAGDKWTNLEQYFAREWGFLDPVVRTALERAHRQLRQQFGTLSKKPAVPERKPEGRKGTLKTPIKTRPRS